MKSVIGRFSEVVIDCADPRGLAEFWRGLLGGEIDAAAETPRWVALVGCTGISRIAFQQVPEHKGVKNRVHIDVDVADLAPATAQAVALGATMQGGVVHELHGMFQVLRDPEDNEFCLVTGYPL